MVLSQKTDTIAAIASGSGDCGIGIVRVSGPDAFAVADKIFKPADGKRPSEYKAYTVHYGWIVDSCLSGKREPSPAGGGIPTTSAGIIDEVLLTVMRAPRSYTKEDVVEINCHGGIVAMRRVLDLVLENGCRMGGPGEFTLRAFLNGRIDLTQAEAVVDVIRAKTDSALKMASLQLEGRLSAVINNLRAALLDVLSILEARIDFPEEELGTEEFDRLKARLLEVGRELKELLSSSRQGRILREGVQAVICGRPNVGKSSLLNALLKQERCIVSPVAGTTRDTIEEIIDIRGIPVKIVDTAGIIEPRDLVEKKAVERASKFIKNADLVLLVFDGSERLSKQDLELMKKLKGRRVLVVINKSDLKQRIEKEKIAEVFSNAINISARRSADVSLLESAIEDYFCRGCISGSGSALVSSARHIEALRSAEKSVAGALDSLDNKLPAEFVAQDIKDALAQLDAIVGKRFSGELLDKIFATFCIGK